MKRILVQRPKSPRERPWLEVLPLDARDPDVVRAKARWREPTVSAEGPSAQRRRSE